jgi:UV radiation resistance-associated gene protein
MSHSSLLPSNTLIVSLAPNGDLFYVPTPQTGEHSRKSSGLDDEGPPSPSLGYSDTELNYTNTGTVKRPKGVRRRSSLPLRADVVNKSMRETKMKKSAGFGDLLK